MSFSGASKSYHSPYAAPDERQERKHSPQLGFQSRLASAMEEVTQSLATVALAEQSTLPLAR
jgi:hypothetical protein